MVSGFIFDIEASMHSIVLSDIMARTDEHHTLPERHSLPHDRYAQESRRLFGFIEAGLLHATGAGSGHRPLQDL